MPSVAQETPPMPSAKKRRRDDHHDASLTTAGNTNNAADHEILPSPSPLHSHHNHISRTLLEDGAQLHYHHVSPLRKVMQLPVVKRIRTAIDDREDSARTISNPSPTTTTETQSRPASPISRPHQRSSHDRPMGRCHVCSRKPTKKSDLDSFADCEGCGQRTCFVCIRQCLGWRPHSLRDQMTGCDREKGSNNNRISLGAMSTDSSTSFTMEDANPDDTENERGQEAAPQRRDSAPGPKDSEGWAARGGHRQMVCSKCCVETGKDGDVVCLGCLPFLEG